MILFIQSALNRQAAKTFILHVEKRRLLEDY